jgi:hypothetical protein
VGVAEPAAGISMQVCFHDAINFTWDVFGGLGSGLGGGCVYMSKGRSCLITGQGHDQTGQSHDHVTIESLMLEAPDKTYRVMSVCVPVRIVYLQVAPSTDGQCRVGPRLQLQSQPRSFEPTHILLPYLSQTQTDILTSAAAYWPSSSVLQVLLSADGQCGVKTRV